MKPNLEIVVVGFIVTKCMMEVVKRLVIGTIIEVMAMNVTIIIIGPVPREEVAHQMETIKS